MVVKCFRLLIFAPCFICEITPASAQGSVIFETSLGMLSGSSTELVYRSSGQVLSQLDWEIDGVPIIHLGSSWQASKRWLFSAQFWTAMTSDGDAHMEDRDWLDVNQSTPTDISVHPDTKLRHAFELDLNATYWFLQHNNFSLGLLSGYQYNELKWEGIGGTYSYSNGTNVGSFADITLIDYKQQFSVFYLGFAAQYQLSSRSTFGSDFKWSPFAYAKDVDNHYLRNLRFYDESNELSDFLSLSLNYSYSFSPQSQIYAEYVYTQYFEARADITQVNTTTGATTIASNAGGLDNQHSIISIGLKYHF